MANSNQIEVVDDYISLTHEIININEIISKASSPKSGAINVFIGTTRDSFEDKTVLELYYESFEEMAVQQMQIICHEVRAKWNVNKIAMQHKLGACPIGEISIIIVISSAHRVDAITACHYAIDRLKETVPIWKKSYLTSFYLTIKEKIRGWERNMERKRNTRNIKYLIMLY